MKKIIYILILLCETIAIGQNWPEIKIDAADRQVHDQFAWSVAISGDYAISGARDIEDPVNSEPTGAVYMFKKDANENWVQTQKILPSDGPYYVRLGNSVSIDGDYAIAGGGLITDASLAGAYIYERGSNGVWTEVQKLYPSDNGQADWAVSYHVDIQGDQAIVGEVRNDLAQGGVHPGAAYIFKRNSNGTWTEVQKIEASDGAANDLFGQAVSIHGDQVVVGARQHANPSIFSGAAYVFKKNANGFWNQVQKLQASNIGQGFSFGVDVGIHGDNMIIGADGALHPSTGIRSGAGYFFKKNTSGNWVETQIIGASDAETSDRFGIDAAIDQNFIIVGATDKKLNNLKRPGAAYIFKLEANGLWNEVQKIQPTDLENSDIFGQAVDIDGGKAIVGTYRHDLDANGMNSLNEAGAAYIYDGDLNSCPEDLIITENVTTGSDIQEAENTVTALNVIYSNTNAEYDAGISVTMTPGFHARAGSTFRAYIDGCEPPTPSSKKDKFDTFTFIPSSGSSFEKAPKEVKVYPNPTQSILNLVSKDAMFQWELTNQLGNVRLTNLLNNAYKTEINIDRYPAGIYFLKVIFFDGEIQMKTIIKE